MYGCEGTKSNIFTGRNDGAGMKFFSFLDKFYPPPDRLGQKITMELSIAQSAVNDLRLKKLRHMDVPMNVVQRHSSPTLISRERSSCGMKEQGKKVPAIRIDE